MPTLGLYRASVSPTPQQLLLEMIRAPKPWLEDDTLKYSPATSTRSVVIPGTANTYFRLIRFGTTFLPATWDYEGQGTLAPNR